MKHLIMRESTEGFTELIAEFKDEDDRDICFKALEENDFGAVLTKAVG